VPETLEDIDYVLSLLWCSSKFSISCIFLLS